MNKKDKYLKFYIDSNNDNSKILDFVCNENITQDEFEIIVRDYLNELISFRKSSNEVIL